MDANPQNGKADNNDGLAGSQAANTAAREKLMEELQRTIGEAESWLKQAASQEPGQPSDLRARFEDTLHTARTDLLKLEDSMLARTRLAAQTADHYVKDNPWKGVALGAALGVITGMLISRK